MEDSLVCAASTRYPSKVLQFLISVQGHHKACAPPSATRNSNYKLLDILHNCEYSMVSWSIGVQEVSVYHARVILRSWASADEALYLSQGLRWRVRLYVVKAPPGRDTNYAWRGGHSRHGRKRGGGPSEGETWRRTLLSTRVDLWI
jgi:hypothetical protein